VATHPGPHGHTRSDRPRLLAGAHEDPQPYRRFPRAPRHSIGASASRFLVKTFGLGFHCRNNPRSSPLPGGTMGTDRLFRPLESANCRPAGHSPTSLRFIPGATVRCRQQQYRCKPAARTGRGATRGKPAQGRDGPLICVLLLSSLYCLFGPKFYQEIRELCFSVPMLSLSFQAAAGPAPGVGVRAASTAGSSTSSVRASVPIPPVTQKRERPGRTFPALQCVLGFNDAEHAWVDDELQAARVPGLR
jgi:hypothetical protein